MIKDIWKLHEWIESYIMGKIFSNLDNYLSKWLINEYLTLTNYVLKRHNLNLFTF